MALRFPGLRNLRLMILAVAIVAAPGVAFAEDDPRRHSAAQGYRRNYRKPRASCPRSVPIAPAAWTSCLGALKAAPDEASAKHVEARIWAVWLQTPSDTAALLMMRAKAAMDAQQVDVALKLLDAVVKLRPDYIEGWNRRATILLSQERLHPLARGHPAGPDP